jgi:hypothetical protein
MKADGRSATHVGDFFPEIILVFLAIRLAAAQELRMEMEFYFP